MERKSPLDLNLEQFFFDIAGIATFTFRYIGSLFRNRFEGREFISQCYRTGYQSLLLIGITAIILGLVLTIQIRPILAGLGAEAWLPNMIFISVVTEMGPVIFALLFAGKVGSGIGAELSSMRVTEQIDAMEVSATNPFNYLVVTRVSATTIMLPILVFFGDMLAFFGSFIGLRAYSEISFKLFYSRAFSEFYFSDMFPATIKTIFFGFFIGIIASYMGYYSGRGTEGVGKAANAAVVASSLVIFLIDLVAVQLTDILTF
ncbi:MAG: ABC transporter permease [Bacteroidales bacterium]|nr:ABC transporter permease [Bacteroidales bacterium]MDT8432794.1 ABC transporter permease [Bacteroidales bacterium]